MASSEQKDSPEVIQALRHRVFRLQGSSVAAHDFIQPRSKNVGSLRVKCKLKTICIQAVFAGSGSTKWLHTGGWDKVAHAPFKPSQDTLACYE